MIKFGTAGWRAIIGDEFTFHNVRMVSQAICNFLKRKKFAVKGLVIGYDTRFLSEKFALEAAKVFTYNKIKTYLCTRDVPTPALCFAIRQRGTAGGVNFTASHNPPEYNGMKIFTAEGAEPLPQVTNEVEKELSSLERTGFKDSYYLEEGYFHMMNPQEDYLALLRQKVDFSLIRASQMKLVVDLLYGTARDYLDRILLEEGCQLKVIHNFRDPYFGGYSPESKEENLSELKQMLRNSDYHIGIATDADSDRFGCLDRGGDYIPANHLLPLLLDYLVKRKGWRGGVARTVATSHLFDLVAKKHKLKVYETPVGFKYIGELILQNKVIMGGEESAGFSIKEHIPEKDGILACLMVAEMAAYHSKNLSQVLTELCEELGARFYNRKVTVSLTPYLSKLLGRRLQHPPKSLDGLTVKQVISVDGQKLLLEDGSWFLIRFSGTEAVVRYYAEADTPEKLERIIESGRRYFFRRGA